VPEWVLVIFSYGISKYCKAATKNQYERLCLLVLELPMLHGQDAFSLCLEFLQGQASSYQSSNLGPGMNGWPGLPKPSAMYV
jgi:hypothetical protein